MEKVKNFLEMLNKASMRSILPVIVILVGFVTVFVVLWDHQITTEEIAFSSAVMNLMIMVLSYYFGSSKGSDDKNQKLFGDK